MVIWVTRQLGGRRRTEWAKKIGMYRDRVMVTLWLNLSPRHPVFIGQTLTVTQFVCSPIIFHPDDWRPPNCMQALPFFKYIVAILASHPTKLSWVA